MSDSSKQRRVLLVEPGYRNKYPPLGLMKLATYHRNRGDYVRFFKGDLRKLLIELYTDFVVDKFYSIDESIDWRCHAPLISKYIQYGHKSALSKIIEISGIYSPSTTIWLKYFYKTYRVGRIEKVAKWDRICVTTLFTFFFKKTIETIEYCKKLVFDENEVWVGGVMASLIPDEVEERTGIRPTVGLLDLPGILDEGDEHIIDQLTPDYSILEEIDYKYPVDNGYFGYTSRGCVRKCEFCAVPVLEPVFKEYLSISKQMKLVDKFYGSRQNLLLLDNNVLASKKFPQIINEIRASGFKKGAKYASPNHLSLAIKNLDSGVNDYAYRRMAHAILINFKSRLSGATLQKYLKILENHGINNKVLPTKHQLLCIYEYVNELYDKRRNKASKYRYVDFNQGVDARLLNEKKMALLATIPIKPLRIAFDSMKYANSYEKAVRLAAKYEIRNLSNYLLFNFKDKPFELYQRMKLNVELSNELNLQLYSFPMRYSPIWDDKKIHHGRTYIGKFWNPKFIRAIQAVLNATKGKVGTRLDFFKAAFGADENEFFKILYMPEAYIFHRRHCENIKLTKSWSDLFQILSDCELRDVLPIIESNDFSGIDLIDTTDRAKCLLRHYRVSYKSIDNFTYDLGELITKTNNHVKLSLYKNMEKSNSSINMTTNKYRFFEVGCLER